MHVLLNVVDDALFEISNVVTEQSNASGGVFDSAFVADVTGAAEISPQKADYTVVVRFRHTTGQFPHPPGSVARGTVDNTTSDDQMAAAEQLQAQDAEPATSFQAGQELAALRARNWSRIGVHGRS